MNENWEPWPPQITVIETLQTTVGSEQRSTAVEQVAVMIMMMMIMCCAIHSVIITERCSRVSVYTSVALVSRWLLPSCVAVHAVYTLIVNTSNNVLLQLAGRFLFQPTTKLQIKSNQIYFSVAGNSNTQYKSIHLRI